MADEVLQLTHSITVRRATHEDVDAISRIYNNYVADSTATFAVAPESTCERQLWFAAHVANNHPVLVAVENDKVVGWGSISQFNSRCAYNQTAELSLYFAPVATGRGFGGKMLDALLAEANACGLHALIAQACTENIASIALFKSRGFVEVGILKQVGRKFDRWLDVEILQKLLGTTAS